MASGPDVILCVGCGDNISNRTSDRRNLLSDSSKSVVMVWKDIVLKKLRSHGMEAEECSTFIQTLQDKHRMCRTCFSAIERFMKLKGSVEKNIEDAINATLSLPVVTRKRRNPTVPTVVSKPKRPQLFVSGGGSPSVAVRNPYDVL